MKEYIYFGYFAISHVVVIYCLQKNIKITTVFFSGGTASGIVLEFLCVQLFSMLLLCWENLMVYAPADRLQH